MKIKRQLVALLLAFASIWLSFSASLAETEHSSESLSSVTDSNGTHLFTFYGTLHEGDEYIAADNTLYRVTAVSEGKATAEKLGAESMPDVSWLDAGAAKAVFADESILAASNQTDAKKLIAMYVTHSDESYIPSDGTESINGQGGIYDVARQLRDELQTLGVDVILDESTHLPHDSGAYRRSRQTAERLLQKRPDAIVDIHRDGIPDENEYICTIDGEPASQVRLLVGRSNQNSEVNREFAKEIKAVADKQYPGLIKDIFIGKGNYNQDLAPNAILLEFGTHTLSKERALESTQMMADVLSTTLYGTQTGSAKAEKTAADKTSAMPAEEKKGSMTGIIIMIAVIIAGIIIFAMVQTGAGAMFGNLVGGALADYVGLRMAFIIFAGAAATLAVLNSIALVVARRKLPLVE